MSEGAAELLGNPHGAVSYEKLREPCRAFVDKSAFIKELDDASAPRYSILLRPRLFGKSAFVQMLKCFYDLSYRDRYEELFSGTDIYKENLAGRNTYHVIDFDFSGVSGDDSETLIDSFIVAIKRGITDFRSRYPDFVFNPTEADKITPSCFISSFLRAYMRYPAKKSLYVMIDEYDNFAERRIFQGAEQFQAVSGAVGFIRDFYAVLKADTVNSIGKIFITGVSSVSLDSLTSGFNIALNVSDDACFNEYAGFTETDLAKLIPQLVDIKQMGVSADEIIARMKTAYGGYRFSPEAEHTVLNSAMCLYYLDEMSLAGEFLPPEDYPVPDADHDVLKLKQLLALAEDGLADEVIDTCLSGDRFLLKKLAENINLNNDARYNRMQLLSMLYYLGYLTIDKKLPHTGRLALKIPNLFMSKVFARCTAEIRLKPSRWFTDATLDISALQEVRDDISSFAASCTEFLNGIFTNQVLPCMSETAINLTLYTKLDSVWGVFAEMQKSLRVIGDGEKYADLVITVNEGKDNECIYLIELKYAAKNEATEARIQSLVNEARDQVLKYSSALEFLGRLVKPYAMVFAGSDCVYCR